MLDKPPPPTKPQTAAQKKAALAGLLRFYGDRDWRLDHLYFVQDETGTKVLYKRRPAQLAYCREQWILDLICKARQLGMSTEIAIEISDFCIFNKDKAAAIIDFKLEDAKKKLAKIKFAYDNLPPFIKERVFLKKANEDEIQWSNGSSCVVGTTHRGGTNQFLHISEFGKIAAEKPSEAREIVTGALQTIAPGQIIKIESTAHGTHGRFYDMVEKAKAKLSAGTPLSVADYKLHFYGWMYRPDYRLPASSVIITQEVMRYFLDPKEGLKAKYGIEVDGEQMAWYQHKLNELGWDDMKEEYPSHIDECFYNSLEGAFFKKELAKARADKRIGFSMPYDNTRRVHTCWDKGMNEKSDRNAIWWFQHDGVRFRFIDYYENAGEGIPHYAGVVEEKRIDRKFVYGKHYGPHDLNQRVWANTSPTPKTMKDIAKECGIDFTVVDRVEDKDISIEAARRAINVSWFCSEYCDQGVKGLDNYRKTWSKILSDWTTVPFHNWASNCFAGDTEVLTRDGIKRISDLPYSGEVLTQCGWKAYRNPRITRRNAPLVEVTFGDGLSVKCTPDHLFLTVSGWKSTERLVTGSQIQSSLMPSANISRVKFIESLRRMDITDMVVSCIERFGHQLSGRFRKVAIFTTMTQFDLTIISKISNAFRPASMRDSLGNLGWQSLELQALMPRHASAPQTGINRKPEDYGIGSMPSVSSPIKSGSENRRRASVAARLLNALSGQMAKLKNGVRRNAASLHITSVKRLTQRADVWCLTVPGMAQFSLSNGAIVHNCADALQCGAMGVQPDKPERESRRDRFGQRKGTQWSN